MLDCKDGSSSIASSGRSSGRPEVNQILSGKGLTATTIQVTTPSSNTTTSFKYPISSSNHPHHQQQQQHSNGGGGRRSSPTSLPPEGNTSTKMVIGPPSKPSATGQPTIINGIDVVRDDFWNRCRVYKKRPKNIFFSQLYSIFHLACTITLLRISGNSIPNRHWFTLTVYYYHGYLLGTSILFIILIRCWTTKDYYGPEEGHPENTSILFGSIALGLVQLIAIGLNLTQCLHDQFLFFPVLQFLFVFLLMHFIFTRAQRGPKYSLKNIAVAHLFACQLSLWLINFDPNHGSCVHRSSINGRSSSSSSLLQPSAPFLSSSSLATSSFASLSTSLISSRPNILPTSFSDLLLPILHNYQLLTAFILGYMWIQNNRCNYNTLKPRLSDLDDNTSFSFAKKPSSIKGFFMGILIISTALIVLLLGNPEITLITHTSIQGLSATAALIGLILRGRKRKGLHKIADPCLDPNDNHIMSIITVAGAYTLAIYDVVMSALENSLSSHKMVNHGALIIQITLQTFLLRSDGRKLHRSRDVFAYLILSNFSLWILEITSMATHMTSAQTLSLHHLPQLLVTLNRFYSGLVFIHFWKIK
ncbi:uncharacterized protein LOC128389407 isoform X2 [Panonychus citri]|nr:uncharacterized protein LOC128389407 isoform X2 [Panonychus citri]